MTIVVSVDAHTGTLRRYMRSHGETILTHEATIGAKVNFAPAVVMDFRNTPHNKFVVWDGTPAPPAAA